MKYFRWRFDPSFESRWLIGEPHLPNGKLVSAWDFMKCHVIEPPLKGLVATTSHGSVATQASFGALGIPYIRPNMAEAILGLAGDEMQLIPVHVNDFDEDVFIVNILNKIKCVDESRSLFEKWAPGNKERPDRVGEYKMIMKLFIDSDAAQGKNILRPWGWTTQVIVSEKMKEVVESISAVGTVFLPV